MVERLLELFAGEEVVVDPALRPVEEVVQETLKAMEDELRLRGYSPRTRKAYRGQVEHFLKWVGKVAQEVTAGDVRAYLLHLADDRAVSASYRNIYFTYDSWIISDHRPYFHNLCTILQFRTNRTEDCSVSEKHMRKIFIVLDKN